MKVLLLSNQGMVAPFNGNPIMLRYRDALIADERIEEVKMLRCKNPFVVAKTLRRYSKEVDIIHLHFGGMYALMVWILLIGINKPKVITFHGTDIHAKAAKTAKCLATKARIKLNQLASFACIMVYDKCGFVAEEMINYVPKYLRSKIGKKYFLERLGVDYNKFVLGSKEKAQDELSLDKGKFILFSDVSSSPIKRRDIAESIVGFLPGYKLLVMCGVMADKVPLYINACDFLLLTSDEEGSPNIIRESLALNKRVFSVDVGDAAKQLEGLTNSAIISRDAQMAADKISEILNIPYTDNTRVTKQNILDFSKCVANVIDMYVRMIKYKTMQNVK